MLETLNLDLGHAKRISPGFWSAIAGAVAAGALVFSDNRIIGGLALGGAMFLVALQLAPCCDGCAEGKGCGGGAPASSPPIRIDPGAGGTIDPQRGALLFAPPSMPSGVDVEKLVADSVLARAAGRCS